MSFVQKPNYSIDDLIEIVALLRNPEGGCPWDIEQTHASIKMNLLEEAYETADAIEKRSSEHLCEELGDLLLQIMLHSQMEAENGAFSFNEVCDGICKKLIYRHPHIFDSLNVKSSQEVLNNWEKLKRAEKNRESLKTDIEDVPKNFPALVRAAKVQKRADAHGLKYPDVKEALADLKSELLELEQCIESNDEAVGEELGDLLFSASNVARALKLDAERELMNSTEKFIGRALIYEELAKAYNGTPQLDKNRADELWQLAKEGFTAEKPKT